MSWTVTGGRAMVLGIRWAAPLVMLAAVTGSAGCSADEAPEPAASPAVSLRASSLAPSTSDASAVQAAVSAYRGMWDAYMRVLATPDPDSPELARYAAGNALTTLVDGVGDVRDQGLRGEGQFVLSPRVVEIAPAKAPTKVGIRDCLNDGAARIVASSPGVGFSDKPGGRRLCLATIERQVDGAWKVSSFGLHEVGSCT